MIDHEMSDTPKTDAAYAAAYRPEQVVSPVNQMRDFARDLERDNARLRAALGELLASAVVLSDDYLSVFSAYLDTDTIQGWDKARWLRASAAAKQARAALRGEG